MCYPIIFHIIYHVTCYPMNHVSIFQIVVDQRWNSFESQFSAQQIFARIAMYKGVCVAVKKIHKAGVTVTDDVIHEINEVPIF